MKTKLFSVMTLILVSLFFFSAAGAQDPYTFELTEAFAFSEKTDNWSIDISLPQISGMPDEDAQAELNSYILSKKDLMLDEYHENTAFGEQSVAEGNEPHFMYQYTWDKVTDNDDYFVFRISWFFAAGSSTTLNEYFNLDKKTGKLLTFDEDAVTSLEEMTRVYEAVYAAMKDVNDSGEGMFWLDDDTLDIALGNVRYLNHWYYNQEGNLVITFDKYEVGPGVMGSPEFVIPAETEEIG